MTSAEHPLTERDLAALRGWIDRRMVTGRVSTGPTEATSEVRQAALTIQQRYGWRLLPGWTVTDPTNTRER